MRIAIVDSESSHKDLIRYLKEANLISDLISYKDGLGPESCDIVLTASAEWHSRSSVMIARAKQQGLPTLHIVDGPVKWGAAWQN